MILSYYILLPFVASVLSSHDNKLFLFPLLIYTFYSFGFTTFNTFYRCYIPGIPLDNRFYAGFSGGTYGLFILYGYFITKGMLSKVKKPYIIAASSVSFIVVVWMQLYLFEKGVTYSVWYDNLFLLIASMGIFELCRRMKRIYGYTVIRAISKYSFPIYLTHNLFVTIFVRFIKSTALNKPFQVLLLWAICFSLSFLLCWIISKIPRFGKYILYM